MSHLIPKETQSTIAENHWSYMVGYIKWFFRVSHPYMVQAALGDPSMLAHQEISEEEQTQLDHAKDVLPRCFYIEEEGIDRDIFPDESDVRQVLDDIMTEARGALMYWK